jgi:hypothetical protein
MAPQLYPESVSKVGRRLGCLVLFGLALLTCPSTALAHKIVPSTPPVAWMTWNWNLWIIGSLSLTAWLYLRGTRGRTGRRAWAVSAASHSDGLAPLALTRQRLAAGLSHSFVRIRSTDTPRSFFSIPIRSYSFSPGLIQDAAISR